MTTPKIVAPKKLIEVALPLEDINKACAREKSIRHGHPSTLHLWWARRPLAAARAVLFAQLVNDPAWKYTDAEQKKPQVRSSITKKRNELFRLITQLVQWESTTNEDVLERARLEIRASWKETCEANKNHPNAKALFGPDRVPPFWDPFAGGGTLPVEALRLGLETYASDLNPVAVMINKAMIEVAPKFAGRSPVGPVPPAEKQTKVGGVQGWSGAKGLSEDVRRYGAWMKKEAEARIGHLYPTVSITKDLVRHRPDLARYEGRALTVIAYLWARTVTSPNPAAEGAVTPLVSSFLLASKPGKEARAELMIRRGEIGFDVKVGPVSPAERELLKNGTRAGKAQDFICVHTKTPVSREYVRDEAKAGRLGHALMAVALEGDRERVYLPPAAAPVPPLDDKRLASVRAMRTGFLAGSTPTRAMITGGVCSAYGLDTWGSLFTDRQLVALDTLSELAVEAVDHVRRDALAAGWSSEPTGLDRGGHGATAYAEAIALYLGIAVARYSNAASTLCTWNPGEKKEDIRFTFARQGLTMTWDFAEGNPLSDSSGNFGDNIETWLCKAIDLLPSRADGHASQSNAMDPGRAVASVISTDPPYYDNIAYADLSDFFYVWLRRSLKPLFSGIFSTIATPKNDELVATAYRHGGKRQAEEFFLAGMTKAMGHLVGNAHPAVPLTLYYAFKQADTSDSEGTASTGWETFLQAAFDAGLGITGTWPIRTEREARSISIGTNALASSIVLVCRPRPRDAAVVARKEFLRNLERVMPSALSEMTADPVASVAPVDLAQAAIGPGMALFSRYAAVLEADGSSMPVRSALVHINKAIDEYFAHAEGELDADTRFCIGWFEQFGFEPGEFGQADVLARAKGTSVEGVKEAGVVEAGKGKVRLFAIKELPKKWDPTTDTRTPIWEALHHMCRALGESEGDAGALLAKMPQKQDAIRQLAYRLYTLCAERKGKAELGRPYNDLITSWPAIVEASEKVGHVGTQLGLL
jgi:putative DNA methylase